MSGPRGSVGNFVDRLLAAVDRGEVELRFNLIALNTPRRPTYSARDNNVWFFGAAGIAVAAFWWLDWAWALVVAIAGFGIFLSIGRKWIFARAQQRAERLLRSDATSMLDFWRNEMVMLHHVPSGTDCVPPDGEWRAFIREHLLIGR